MDKPFAMIIEDDRDTVALFRHVLDFAGYKTEIILRGERAIDRLKIAGPDIILLDLNLPGVSGMEILEFIQTEEQLADADIALHFAKQEDFRLAVFNPVTHARYRDTQNYVAILRVGLSPKDATKPREE